MNFSAVSPKVFKAVLALDAAACEGLDPVLPGGVSDAVYEEAARLFEEKELAQLIALIFTTNAWNRMNVTTRKTPGTE
ncbi:hypothetical protein [Streptomyces cyaneofuscatus]|uniref:Carboxymuconolactone decarboxylase family protein n=1 Tax=Streptomyces cyaneofuscatus TaxID=66883 RepID=A0ABZ1F7Z7_9ACTN|nr:hypothetical protein [Streptomyces cyaneofuscatus]WSB12313.1 hypothetical protein OG849_11940 [Streptomyces cyaneofuscatus]WSD50996.1 hypothetical protein OG857_23465 [Streptomyces cyaneofuscatus]WTA94501.1 hypothetical protein OG323_24630 [Streptomyces cyaneofuscatus]